MNSDDKVYDLFNIDQEPVQDSYTAPGKKPASDSKQAAPEITDSWIGSQEPTRRVPDKNTGEPYQMPEFAFDDVIIQDQAPVSQLPLDGQEPPQPIPLDLDGKPLGGTPEQQIRQERKDRRRKTGKILSGILDWVKEIAIALVIVWFVITFIAQNNNVVGTSMQPTVYANDMVIVNKVIYRFSEPKRGDIVVFPAVENGKKVFLIKRIIGLPGDVVDIRDGKVIVNDKELVEKYISVETSAVSGQTEFPLTVPEKQYFVLGDNRIVSKDSRYLAIGTIPRSKIVGKASIRIWPFKNIGFIE